jgi:hypothetical protein
MVQDDGPVGLDGVQVKFDDERVVSDAGLMLAATLAERLGIEELAQRLVRLRPKRPGADGSDADGGVKSRGRAARGFGYRRRPLVVGLRSVSPTQSDCPADQVGRDGCRPGCEGQPRPRVRRRAHEVEPLDRRTVTRPLPTRPQPGEREPDSSA